MAKIYDDIEIGLTQDELRQSLRAWLDRKGAISDYHITDVSLHPGRKYVVRFTVAPPLQKADAAKVQEVAKTAS